jgi:ribosomal 50S subunit-recycling heat shock protein
MANYNTFLVIDCNSRKTLLNTSSARKASKELKTGVRIEVWNNNELVTKIYEADRKPLEPYIQAEREYIRKKQAAAERRNKARKEKAAARIV